MGDTLTSREVRLPSRFRLQGRQAHGVAGLFPTDSDEYPELRDALEKLKLNDAALVYEPETSQALGSASGAGSSDCCTWKSFANASSVSSTSTCS